MTAWYSRSVAAAVPRIGDPRVLMSPSVLLRHFEATGQSQPRNLRAPVSLYHGHPEAIVRGQLGNHYVIVFFFHLSFE